MENKKKKIIFDCDNTFGVTDCDVDDGLALLYLLGCADAEVCGITGTYGNNNIDVVMSTIHAMLKDLGREDITVKRGGASCGEYESEAARYLAQMADKTGGFAFVMYPTSMEDLMKIADESRLMPPKSTGFEPKLRSGLFIHKLY